MSDKKFNPSEFMLDALEWITGDKKIKLTDDEEDSKYRAMQLLWYCEQYSRLFMEKNLELCDIACIFRKYIQISTSPDKKGANIMNALFGGIMKSEEDEVTPVYSGAYQIHAFHGMEPEQFFWIFRLEHSKKDMIDVTVCSITHHTVEECKNEEVLCRVVLPDGEILTQKPGEKVPLSKLKEKLIDINHIDLWEALVHTQAHILIEETKSGVDERLGANEK